MGKGNLLDEFLDEFEAEFKRKRKKRKGADQVPPRAGSLVPIAQSSAMPVPRSIEVHPYDDSRAARKQAEEERKRRARMLWDAQRVAAAVDLTGAAVVHGQQQLDAAQDAMSRQFYHRERSPAMNQFMAEATGELLMRTKAATMAYLEVLPKKLGEEL